MKKISFENQNLLLSGTGLLIYGRQSCLLNIEKDCMVTDLQSQSMQYLSTKVLDLSHPSLCERGRALEISMSLKWEQSDRASRHCLILQWFRSISFSKVSHTNPQEGTCPSPGLHWNSLCLPLENGLGCWCRARWLSLEGPIWNRNTDMWPLVMQHGLQ